MLGSEQKNVAAQMRQRFSAVGAGRAYKDSSVLGVSDMTQAEQGTSCLVVTGFPARRVTPQQAQTCACWKI